MRASLLWLLLLAPLALGEAARGNAAEEKTLGQWAGDLAVGHGLQIVQMHSGWESRGKWGIVTLDLEVAGEWAQYRAFRMALLGDAVRMVEESLAQTDAGLVAKLQVQRAEKRE